MPGQLSRHTGVASHDSLSMADGDEELWVLARTDQAALTALYRRHARPLLGFCVRRTGDAELAAEVTAEVFAAVVLAVRAARPAPGSVSAWLYGTARHKIADAARRGRVDAQARARLGLPSLALSDEGIERVLEAAGDVRVRAALEALPADQRVAVQRRVVGEEPYARIAAAQGTTAAAVRQRVTRGLARLRGQLEDQR